MDANTLKNASGSALDAAGAELNLDRVKVSRGHGFDESDDSYRRRLLAEMVGAAAADAISQPPAEEKEPEAPAPAKTADAQPPAPPPPQAPALRADGPTVEEWVMAGMMAKDYPPPGYAARSSEDEVKAAIAAQTAAQAHVPHESANHVDPAAVGSGTVQQGDGGNHGASPPHSTPLP